jgi:formamidopyrimidine-DNA glycosylase
MGVIQVRKDDELDSSYVYKRDFDSTKLSAAEEEFTFEQFSGRMAEHNKMLKSVLVGKDAILVGISNSTFQDILYRARIHPKRRASELEADEMRSLYDTILFVFNERIRLNGKDNFRDLHGKQGGYVPAMGSNMKQQSCPECGTPIEKLSHGGGHVYLCPNCQK